MNKRQKKKLYRKLNPMISVEKNRKKYLRGYRGRYRRYLKFYRECLKILPPLPKWCFELYKVPSYNDYINGGKDEQETEKETKS